MIVTFSNTIYSIIVFFYKIFTLFQVFSGLLLKSKTLLWTHHLRIAYQKTCFGYHFQNLKRAIRCITRVPPRTFYRELFKFPNNDKGLRSCQWLCKKICWPSHCSRESHLCIWQDKIYKCLSHQVLTHLLTETSLTQFVNIGM